MICFFSPKQLRVVRAFKSTLEDLEEKRSVHSFHSLHSSRSHQGHRPLFEEVLPHHPEIPKSSSALEQNGSYTNMALVIQENHSEHRKMSTKSRSAENVSLLDPGSGAPTVVVQAASPNASPRTYSSDNNLRRLHETSI